MGQKTVEFTQKVRYAITFVADLGARQVQHEAAKPMRARLDKQLREGARLRGFVAFFAHGNDAHQREFLVFRREWYEWTKQIEALMTAVQLSPEDLRKLNDLGERC